MWKNFVQFILWSKQVPKTIRIYLQHLVWVSLEMLLILNIRNTWKPDLKVFPICGMHMTSSKHDYADYDQFAPNFDMAYKTIQRVSVLDLTLFGSMKTELWTKEVGNFSITLYEKMGWWAFSCPSTWLPQYKRIEIFSTLNAYNSCIYWCINLKLSEILQIGVTYIL